jgi:hypothetical protein
MKRLFAATVMVTAILSARPSAAQGAGLGPVPAGPIINSWYLGVNTGTAVVERFGGVFAGEGGLRVWKSLDLVGELVWTQNAVSRRQLDRVETLARSIGGSSDMRVPTFYGGLGARWVIEQGGRFRPYFLATIGGARMTQKPALRVNGTDVTGSAAQYGITLGQDVIGKYHHFGAEGGLGVVTGIDTWYFDVGARLLTVNSQNQRTNIARLVLGGGYRF